MDVPPNATPTDTATPQTVVKANPMAKPESAPSELLIKQHLKTARSKVSKLVNKANSAVEQAEHTEVGLNILRRSKLAIQEGFEELATHFAKFIELPSISSNEAILDKEFGSHSSYTEKAEEAVERLDVKIDEICVDLNIELVAPESVRPASRATQSQEESRQQSSSPMPGQRLDFQSVNENSQQTPDVPETEESDPASSGTPRTLQNNPASSGTTQILEGSSQPLYFAQDPATKVPIFKGDITQFHEWWNLLHYYVDAKSIDPTEKCRILKNSVQGKAGRYIQHLPVCAESYDLAKKIMLKRYGQSQQAQTAHIQKIHQLCSWKDLAKNDKFIDFLSLLSQHVNALVVLGFSYESLSAALTPVILACIPQSCRIRFNTGWRKVEDTSACKLEHLMEFLDEQSIILEESVLQEKFSLLNLASKQSQNKSKFSKESKEEKEVETNKKGSKFSFGGNISKPDHSCIFCQKDHNSAECKKKLSPEERRKRIAATEGCLRCLRRNHDVKKCRAKVENCSKCSEKHNVLVCLKKEEAATATASSAASSTSDQSALSPGASETLVQTAYAWAVNGNKKIMCRILLDPGSQVSFVSKKVAKTLGLRPVHSQEITINGVIGQKVSEEHIETVEFKLRSRFSGSEITIACLAVKEVMQGTLPRAIAPPNFENIADKKEIGFPEKIDVLVGANWLHLIYNGMYKKLGSVTASPTKFGWVFWGDTNKFQIKSSVVTSLACIQVSTNSALAAPKRQEPREDPDDLQFLWNSELLGIENPNEEEDRNSKMEAEKFIVDTIKRTPGGRYIVSLPFRENLGSLGSNEKLAYSCLVSLIKRGRNKPEFLTAIDNEIKKLIESGCVEPAEPRRQGEQAHYLPLLAVAKKSMSASAETRVRVVKDGGARSKDQAALNDVLEKGPSSLPDIVTVLLNFRRKKIAIVCDIEKAFHQFLINKKHRTFLRFFWAPGVGSNPEAPIKEFWGTVLDFGLVCSPWLHCAGVKYHLDSEIRAHPEREEFLRDVQKHCYMDDVQSGANNLKEATQAVEWLVESFEAGHFPLNKWATNSQELRSHILETQHSGTQVALPKDNYKFLGVPWDLQQDTTQIQVSQTADFLASGKPSKRRLLKGLSQIFDPLGQIASIAIGLKVLLQTLWTQKIDWDEPLSGELEDNYRTAVNNLNCASGIRVERLLFRADSASRKELHCFGDASLRAYGCVAYVRQTFSDPKKKASISFIMAKGRVAPLAGKWTIHRLELMAAIVATRIAKKIQESLPGEFDGVFLYTDNAAVLGWLRDRPDRWKPFVANRVKEIHASTKAENWSYCKSQDNPADLLSRCSPLDTPELQRFWLEGPQWLAKGRPRTDHQLERQRLTQEGLAEEKVEASAAATSVQEPSNPLINKEFSSWGKLVRVTAYIQRFIRRASKKEVSSDKEIGTNEFKQAEEWTLKNIQKQHFGAEFNKECADLQKSSALYKLNPFIDPDGWIRCRSRLAKATGMSDDEKNPIILPGDDHSVQLYIREIHKENCLHSGGIARILHEIRKKFFITAARRAAKKALHGCKVCTWFRAQPASEPVPPLPAFRLGQCPPFSITGVDHAGPLYYKEAGSNQRVKAYALLFVCPTTRGLRIELVADLSTNEFLLALRRFVSRNPAVTRIVSDNARTFKKADREIALWFDSVKKSEINSFLTRKRIDWQFTTAKAPWQGGWWERIVQVIKRPLRKALGSHQTTFRHLEATLMEIEKMVNDRPISAIITDPNEPRALSPAQLMYGYDSQPNLPETRQALESAEAANAIIFTERWKKQQSALRGFWKQFKHEYLQYLRSLHYNRPQASKPLREGQICILQADTPSRAHWPLVRIVETFGGEATDRKRRSCKVLTTEGKILSRPIQLLYPLEVDQF